ncbi:hypothetical protein FACS1894196_2800 [Clostridia bacterium]|nr:hypothetical protein FACS1894196_2800 [Clostridia bacterium]
MMNTGARKRFWGMVLAVVVMALCIVPWATGYAATSGDYAYSTNSDGTVTITAYKGKSAKPKIPNKLNGKRVTAIGDEAFYDCATLTSITLPDSVSTIGANAFSGCVGLTSITLPDNVTDIGAGAFSFCVGLTSITFSPDSVTSIGDGAFSFCLGLTSITLPGSVTDIGAGAFSFAGLTSITLPDGVISIGATAFLGCTDLASVTLPDSVTDIGEGAFSTYGEALTLSVPSGSYAERYAKGNQIQYTVQ